jgi:hypothetical protein
MERLVELVESVAPAALEAGQIALEEAEEEEVMTRSRNQQAVREATAALTSRGRTVEMQETHRRARIQATEVMVEMGETAGMVAMEAKRGLLAVVLYTCSLVKRLCYR